MMANKTRLIGLSIGMLILASAAAPAMDFQYHQGRDTDIIIATGDIEAGDTQKFFDLFHDLEGQQMIVLDSPGGSIPEGMSLGRLIRSWDLETYVPESGECYSACFYVFSGGLTRKVSGELGVHRFSFPDPAPTAQEQSAAAQSVVADAITYLVEMGIEPEALSIGLRTAVEEMYTFSPQELLDLNIITGSVTGKQSATETEACPFDGITHQWRCGERTTLLRQPEPAPVGCELEEYTFSDTLGLYPQCHR